MSPGCMTGWTVMRMLHSVLARCNTAHWQVSKEVNLCSRSSHYSRSCHIGAMLVFRMLSRITPFSKVHRTVSVSDGSCIDNGSEFHKVGPEIAKHLWPYLVVLKHGTARSCSAAARRCPRLADSDTGEHSSARSMLVQPDADTCTPGHTLCRHTLVGSVYL